MSNITFSFLIIDDTFQDSVTFEVNEGYTLEEVVVRLCESFGFNKFNAVRNNHDIEVLELNETVAEIERKYGSDLKLIVTEPEGSFETQGTTMVQEDEPIEIEQPTEIADKVLKRIVNVTTQDWKIDGEGKAEIILFPLIKTYISQLRVRYDVNKPMKQLVTKIAITLGYQPREVAVIPLEREWSRLTDLNQSLQELAEKYGPVFILLSQREGEKLAREEIGDKIVELISTYL